MPKLSTARQSLARLDARIASLRDPRHKAWLTTYRNHWWSEVIGDVPGVMKTMSRGPIRYTFDGHPFMAGEGMAAINSYEATEDMYSGVDALGVNMAGPVDEERILFDEHGLAVTCILTAIYPGLFFPNHNEPIDPKGLYLACWPNITLIRFDEAGLMMGEDITNGAPLLVKKVDRSWIPRLIDGPLEII